MIALPGVAVIPFTHLPLLRWLVVVEAGLQNDSDCIAWVRTLGVVFLLKMLAWLALVVGVIAGVRVSTRSGPSPLRGGALGLGALAVGVAVLVQLLVEDGQPFIVFMSRSDNSGATAGFFSWLALRTLAFNAGVGLLIAVVYSWWSDRWGPDAT
jgi:hypothetical protein